VLESKYNRDPLENGFETGHSLSTNDITEGMPAKHISVKWLQVYSFHQEVLSSIPGRSSFQDKYSIRKYSGFYRPIFPSNAKFYDHTYLSTHARKTLRSEVCRLP